MSYTDAFDIVTKTLKKDKDCRRAWQDNIAMSFKDTLHNAGYMFPDLHKLANEAATQFIEALIKKSE